MPLKLSLKPNEKIVVNGAVLQNGDRRSNVLLKNKASVLREKDIMQIEEAKTPAKRVYFPVMMMYIEQTSQSPYYDEFVLRLSEVMGAVQNPEILQECIAISRDILVNDYYRALGRCRKLIQYEEQVGNAGENVDNETAERRSA